MNSLINQYVKKLTIDNINDFAQKNNINLNKKELNVLLEVVQNHYQKILNGDDSIKDYLKEHLTKENYDKVIKIYNEYKEKYQNYL